MRKSLSPIEEYFISLRPSKDPRIAKSRQAAEGLGLDAISLGDLELDILATMVSLSQSHKFVEVGTLTGTSGLALLHGMPKGAQLWTLEKDDRHADLAEPLLVEAALAKQQICHVVRGDARQTLPQIEAHGPFDGIFIDGNKAAYGDYLAWAEKNVRNGGLIVADNVFLNGAVYGSVPTQKFSAKQIETMKKFNERLLHPELYQSCFIPTAEGLTVALKLF